MRTSSAVRCALAAAVKLVAGSLGWAGTGFCIFWIFIALSEQGVGIIPGQLVGRLLDFSRTVHGDALWLAEKLKYAELCVVIFAATALVSGYAFVSNVGITLPHWLSLIFANKGVTNTLSATKRGLAVVLPLLVGATMLASDTGACPGDSCLEHTLGRMRLTLESQDAKQRFADLRGTVRRPTSTTSNGSSNPPTATAHLGCVHTEDDSLCTNLVRVFERVLRDSNTATASNGYSGGAPDDQPTGGSGDHPTGGPAANHQSPTAPSGPGSPPRPHNPPHQHADELAARDLILRAFADNRATVVPPGQEHFGLSAADAEVMSAVENAVADAAPRSVAGADVESWLHPILAAVGPQGRERLHTAVATWLKSFGEVDSSSLDRDVANWAIGFALEHATDVHIGSVDMSHLAPAPDLAKKAGAKFLSEGGLHYYTGLRDRFLAGVLRVAQTGISGDRPPGFAGPEIPGIAQAIQSAREQFPSLDELANKAAREPPELWERNREAQLVILRTSLESLHSSEPNIAEQPSDAKRMVAIAATFQDEFPGRPDDPGPTAIQSLPPDWTPPNPGTSAAKLPEPSTDEQRRLSNLTRDFDAMSKYDKVGGVVIGQLPSLLGLPPRRIDWNIDPIDGQITLEIEQADGGTQKLGPFDSDIVFRALAYAADGRVVAATIVPLDNGFQEATLRVLVHPALQGSRIGNAVFDIDRWVFDVPLQTGSQFADSQAISEFYASEAWLYLYKLSFAHFQLHLSLLDDKTRKALSSIDGISDEEAKSHISALLDVVQELEDVAPRLLQVARASPPPWKTGTSPIPSEIGGLVLKDWLLPCVDNQSNRDAKALYECLDDEAARAPGTRAALVGIDKAEVPRFAAVSGVRQDMSASGGLRDPLWPFKFIVQFAFGMPEPRNHRTNSHRADKSRPEALVLTDLEAPITTQLQRFVANDSHARQTLSTVQKFTILQQVFRNALFAPAPMPERLVLLARQLQPMKRDYCPVPLWDGQSGPTLVNDQLAKLQRISSANDASVKLPPETVSSLAQCAAVSNNQSFTWKDFAQSCKSDEIEKAWVSACKSAADPWKCLVQPLTFHEIVFHLRLLSVRHALDISASDKLGGPSCQ